MLSHLEVPLSSVADYFVHCLLESVKTGSTAAAPNAGPHSWDLAEVEQAAGIQSLFVGCVP